MTSRRGGLTLEDENRRDGEAMRGAADLIFLSATWRWFGNHTGYAQFVKHLPASHTPRVVEHDAKTPTRRRLLRRIAARRPLGHLARSDYAGPGSRFLDAWRDAPDAVGHVLYFEHHHAVFAGWRRAPRNLIATIHHPPVQMERWRRAMEDMGRLSSAIVLYQRDIDFFEQYVGKGRVRFIHHGVDTEFFSPGTISSSGPHRLLYVGINGRDTEMLQRVVRRVTSKRHDVRIDVLVPNPRYKPRLLLDFAGLWRHPSVRWHWDLDDEALRKLYRASDLLLLPLRFAAACNAIVEALASGLPVVTTDVGGVRDYGAGSIYPVVPAGHDTAMLELIERYLADRRWRDEVATQCRRFAEATLSWPRVATAHVRAYRDLAGG